MPLALHFLLGYPGQYRRRAGRRRCRASAIISTSSTRFLFGFGVAFLLPVLLMLLERAGLVTRQQLKRGRRYAIVVAFVVAAVLTPPDVDLAAAARGPAGAALRGLADRDLVHRAPAARKAAAGRA